MTIINRLKVLLGIKNKSEVEVLQGIDIEKIYEDPKISEEIRQKIQQNENELDDILLQYEENTKNLADFQRINDMPADELYELEDISMKYSDSLLRRKVFEDLVNKQDADTMYLEKYKEEIPKAILRIEEYEEKQRVVMKDLQYLEGEKGDINYSKNRSHGALSFTKAFTIFLAVAVAITALILLTMAQFYQQDILIPALVSIVITVVALLWVSIFRRHLIHDIKKNNKLQVRAVELLNKVKIKYVHNQQLLDYQYKKYRINSSEMLRLRFENYNTNIENEKEYNSIEHDIHQFDVSINRLLLRNNIEGYTSVIDNIDYFSREESRNQLIESLAKKKIEQKERIDFLKKQTGVLREVLKDYISD